MQRLSERKSIFLFFALGWTSLITYFSMSDVRMLPTIKIQDIDKGVHFVFHFVFTLSWYMYLGARNGFVAKSLFQAMLLSLLYGITIEIAQGTLTTYRSADPLDVLANSSGALACSVVVILAQKSFKLIK
ncbi:MAG: VanZ family protein [Bacteroidetes bacterium]|nr:VanZ family protein [Bacteroidota bacterium]